MSGRRYGNAPPPTEEAIEAAGMWPIREYVQRRKETTAEYIVKDLVLELCTRVERIPGHSWSLMWWDQDHRREEGGN